LFQRSCPASTPAPQTVRAKRNVYDFTRGRLILKGSTALETDDVVAEHLDDWKAA
jgi:hypothetical protein